MAKTKLAEFDSAQRFLENTLRDTLEDVAFFSSHQISVVGMVYRICKNARRTQVSLYVIGSKSFLNYLIEKHKKLLDADLGIPTSIRCTSQGIYLKAILPPCIEITPLYEGMKGMFSLFMLHTSAMPKNVTKDFLIFFKPFSEYEK